MDNLPTAAIAAASAAEAVRALNHHTMQRRPDGPGEDLADAYAVIGELRVLSQRLPQALRQIAALVEPPPVGVVYGTDNDHELSPHDLLDDIVLALSQSTALADELRRHLDTAHNALGHLRIERQLSIATADGDPG